MREQIFVEIKLNKSIAKNKTFCSVSPRGVLLLLILVGGVPPGSPNPDPISDRKMSFSRPVFRPSLMLVLLKLERKQKKFLKFVSIFEFAYFSFFLTHLQLKR